MAIQEISLGVVANNGEGDPLREGGEKINQNFTDPLNAASYEVGAGAGQIPRNDDLGTAAQANTGTAAGEVPTNGDLGTASTKDTGTATGQIPTADQLSMVGETVNYTGANLNPNVFGGAAGFKVATGYARGATALRVDLAHSVNGVDQSIIKGAGSFNVTDTFFNVLFVVPPANITIATENQKLMTINISGLSGLVADRPYFLTSIAANSTLEIV